MDSMVKFKFAKNLIKEEKEKISPIKKHKLVIKNNKLLIFVPLKPIRDKKYKDISYSVLPDNVKSRPTWINCPLWGKLEGEWKKYSGIREYWKCFKNDLMMDNYLISLREEKEAGKEDQEKV